MLSIIPISDILVHRFFAGFVITMTLWTIFLLPETKGKDLENTFRTFQTHP